jgi:hypothetical protein
MLISPTLSQYANLADPRTIRSIPPDLIPSRISQDPLELATPNELNSLDHANDEDIAIMAH